MSSPNSSSPTPGSAGSYPLPVQVQPDPAIHNLPAALKPGATLTSQQVNAYRQQFIELILRQVVLAIQGFLTGGGAFGQITTIFNNIPLIGPLLSAITGSSTTGGGGLGGLGSFFTDFKGLLGNPTGLGTGTTGLPGISSIPLFGGLLSGGNILTSIIPGLDASKIVSGLFSQSQISGLVSSLANLLPFNIFNRSQTAATNLVISPDFEDTTITRAPQGGAYSTEQAHGGTRSFKMTKLASGVTWLPLTPIVSPSGDPYANNAEWLKVQPGQKFYMESWVYGHASNTGTTLALLYFNCRDSKGVTAEDYPIATIPAVTSSAWNKISGYVTIPAGLDLGLPGLQVGTAATGNVVYFDDVIVREETASQNIIAQLFGGSTILSTILAGNVPALDASKIGSGQFPFSMITNLSTMMAGFSTTSSISNQLIGLFGGTTGGLTGLSGLGSIFNDMLGILGSPTALGSGAPNAAIPSANVAGIQGIVDIGNSMQNTWNQLTTAYGGATVATNEVQRIIVSDLGGGTVTGGGTTLNFRGQTTASSVAYNATAAAVQTALTGLSTIGAGNLVASGGPLNSTNGVSVTFQGTFANTAIELLGHTDSLTGGTQPRASIAELTRGGDTTTLANLASLAQTQTQAASLAQTLATTATNLLGLRINRPLFNSINPLSEGSHNLASGTVVDVAATATSAPMSLQIVQQDITKTYVQVLAAVVGTVTSFYLNIYRFDSSVNLQSIYKSADLSSQLGASKAWLTGSFSGAPVNTVAGDILATEAIVVGSGTVNMRGLTLSDVPVHPTAVPKHFAASRNPTGNLQPTTITGSGVSYGGNQLFATIGTGTAPPPYQPPVTTQYTVPGTYTYTIPVFARVAGAKLDIITLGAGGGGQGNYGTLTYYTGGNAGIWGTSTTVTCGVDYPVGATTLKSGGSGIVVGAKGTGAGAYWSYGHTGSASSVTWTNLSSVNTTITANGGLGGGNSGTSGSIGKSPGNIVYLGQTYTGGTQVGGNATGSPPGGGGGGAGPYQTGGDGAPGSVWIVARQS